MTDVMDQLRGAQPMPRGERLATWLEHRSTGTQFIGRAWRFLGEHDLPFGKHIRAHAAPLALARERRRRERAEAWLDHRMGQLAQAQEDIASLRADVIEYEAQMHAARGEAVERLEQARHWREQAKAAEAEMLRLRAAVPTREEVERAVDALEQSLAALEVPDEAALDAAGDRYDAARAALVALATRGTG